MDLFAELQWRGLVNQCTAPETVPGWLATAGRSLYCGFDPTSDSLHVGSLLPVMLLRRFQKAGHKPIALVGGATGMIGDPSGKSEERNLQSLDQLEKNVAGIEKQLRGLLDFEGASAARLLNNFDWMRGFSFLEFLRDVGKHFPVGVMLGKDSVKGRLERDTGISYTEFSYMLLQAYDFVFLHQKHGCELQIGGSDQWGNITAGIDLARRMHGAQLFGLTCPLLLKSDGTKMGKTERGAVYLSPERTSPYAFYQYWVNLADADCGSALRFLTELPREEIEDLDKKRTDQPHLRESQKRLAEELTRLIHGEGGLAAAKNASDTIFGKPVENLTDAELTDIFAEMPRVTIPRDRLAGEGLGLADALVETGLAKSKSDARRTIAQGGAYVNNRPRTDTETRLTAADLASETVLVLRSGKKKYALVRFA
ncbi:MAG: tyrosine--tRNA ligase [Pirellulaceae bacterium]|nr:tyrosine--tRNA ligase [Pirellulaceae bacterium]